MTIQSICRPPQHLEILRKHFHAARSLFPIEVFVWSVIAVLRQTESQENDRRLEILLHCHDGADGSAFSHPRGSPAKSRAHRLGSRIRIGPGFRTKERFQKGLRNYLNMRVSLLDESFHETEYFRRVLIGHQTHAEFRFGSWCDCRF